MRFVHRSEEPLTEEEIERSKSAHRYEGVKPAQLWGRAADPDAAVKAAKIRDANPVRYRELKAQAREEGLLGG